MREEYATILEYLPNGYPLEKKRMPIAQALGKINFTRIKFTKNNESDPEGYFTVKGIDLTLQNRTKKLYVDDQDNATNLICILDEEVESVDEISSNCGNGISINCDNENGTIVNNNGRNYTCTKLDDGYKVEGLIHSGVKEYTYVTPQQLGGGGGGGSGGGMS